MVLKKLQKFEKEDKCFYSAIYETTYELDWPKILFFAQEIIKECGNTLDSIVTGNFTNENSINGQDFIDELKTNNFNIFECENLKHAKAVLRMVGKFKTTGGPANTIWFYNSNEKHKSKAFVIELMCSKNNDPFVEFGQDFFTPLFNKIEIEGTHKFYMEFGL